MRKVLQVVTDRMNELDLGPYDVAKLVSGKMSPQTVYNFVKGRSEMNTDCLAHVLDALGLEIRPRLDGTSDTTSRKSAVSKRKPARSAVKRKG